MLIPDRRCHVAHFSRGWWSWKSTVSHVTHWLPLPGLPPMTRNPDRDIAPAPCHHLYLPDQVFDTYPPAYSFRCERCGDIKMAWELCIEVSE
jgi:hypothetical protein